MKFQSQLVLAACLLAPAMSFNAHAQDSDSSNYLVINPVVSISNYQSTPLSDVLLSTDVITQEEIQASTATSFGELISQKTGVEVTRSGGEGAQTSIFLRGQASKNYVLLIDGIRVQADPYGNLRPMDVPLSQIEKIEVLKGNASALHGDAAIGGVINIITKTGELRDGGYISVTSGSRNTNGADVGLSQNVGGVDVSVSASTFETDGIDATKESESDTDDFNRKNQAISISKRISAQTRLKAGYKSSASNSKLDGYYKRLESKNTDYNLSFEHKSGPLMDARLEASTGKLKYDSFGVTDSYAKGKQNAYKLINISRFSSDTTTQAITQGLEVSDSEYDKIDRGAQAVFLGYLLRSDPHSLQVNLRNDDIDIQNPGSPQKTFSATSWLMGYGYQLTPSLTASLARSTGFRAPSAGEYSSNSDLKAEKHKSTELSLQHQGEQSLSRVTLFKTDTDNGIQSWPIKNIEEISNQGAEFIVSRRSDFVDYRFNLTLQEPKIKNSTSGANALQKRARTHANLNLSKQVSGYNINSTLIYAGKRSDVNDKTMSSYVRLDASLSRNLTQAASVVLKAENITDADYETTSGYNTAGRSLYLTLKYDFATAY